MSTSHTHTHETELGVIPLPPSAVQKIAPDNLDAVQIWIDDDDETTSPPPSQRPPRTEGESAGVSSVRLHSPIDKPQCDLAANVAARALLDAQSLDSLQSFVDQQVLSPQRAVETALTHIVFTLGPLLCMLSLSIVLVIVASFLLVQQVAGDDDPHFFNESLDYMLVAITACSGAMMGLLLCLSSCCLCVIGRIVYERRVDRADRETPDLLGAFCLFCISGLYLSFMLCSLGVAGIASFVLFRDIMASWATVASPWWLWVVCCAVGLVIFLCASCGAFPAAKCLFSECCSSCRECGFCWCSCCCSCFRDMVDGCSGCMNWCQNSFSLRLISVLSCGCISSECLHRRFVKSRYQSLPCARSAAEDFVLNHLQLDAGWFETTTCYCQRCWALGDFPKSRTQGGAVHGVPSCYTRFGLPPSRGATVRGLDKWHVAYHGTTGLTAKAIIETQQMLMPGDRRPDGGRIEVRPGHIEDVSFARKVFMSPSVIYTSCLAYATPHRHYQYEGKSVFRVLVALELLVCSNAYEVGPETIGAGNIQVDPLFSNDELEWFTDRRGVIEVNALLVRVDGVIQSHELEDVEGFQAALKKVGTSESVDFQIPLDHLYDPCLPGREKWHEFLLCSLPMRLVVYKSGEVRLHSKTNFVPVATVQIHLNSLLPCRVEREIMCFPEQKIDFVLFEVEVERLERDFVDVNVKMDLLDVMLLEEYALRRKEKKFEGQVQLRHRMIVDQEETVEFSLDLENAGRSRTGRQEEVATFTAIGVRWRVEYMGLEIAQRGSDPIVTLKMSCMDAVDDIVRVFCKLAIPEADFVVETSGTDFCKGHSVQFETSDELDCLLVWTFHCTVKCVGHFSKEEYCAESLSVIEKWIDAGQQMEDEITIDIVTLEGGRCVLVPEFRIDMTYLLSARSVEDQKITTMLARSRKGDSSVEFSMFGRFDLDHPLTLHARINEIINPGESTRLHRSLIFSDDPLNPVETECVHRTEVVLRARVTDLQVGSDDGVAMGDDLYFRILPSHGFPIYTSPCVKMTSPTVVWEEVFVPEDKFLTKDGRGWVFVELHRKTPKWEFSLGTTDIFRFSEFQEPVFQETLLADRHGEQSLVGVFVVDWEFQGREVEVMKWEYYLRDVQEEAGD